MAEIKDEREAIRHGDSGSRSTDRRHSAAGASLTRTSARGVGGARGAGVGGVGVGGRPQNGEGTRLFSSFECKVEARGQRSEVRMVRLLGGHGEATASQAENGKRQSV